MSYARSVAVAVTTDASGDVTAYSAPVNGRILTVVYTPHASTPLDTGADVTVTTEDTAQSVWAESNIGTSALSRAPRQATHATDGTASLYAGAGEPVEDYIWAAGDNGPSGERIKVVVAQGGNAKSGTFTFIVG